MLRSKSPRQSIRGRNLRSLQGEGDRTRNTVLWMDVWLPRLSQLAQFGLFVITLGGLYFTVLPLYQKALLEEAIAKREVELATATAAIDRAYARIRSYAVREFYIASVPPCSGLLQPPADPVLLGDRPTKRLTRFEFVYAIDVPKCLNDALTTTAALSELRPRDRQFFQKAIEALAVQLVETRRRSMSRDEAAAAATTEADVAALPASSPRVQHLQLVERIYGATAVEQKRRELAVQMARERIGMEYEEAIRSGIRNLSKLVWPHLSNASE